MGRALALLAAGTVVIGALVAVAPGSAAAVCDHPAQVLDPRNWKVQLPIGGDEDPDEVEQPALAGHRVDPWFVADAGCGGVRFRAAVNGVTTSGSNYPRSELREMTDGGTRNAAWSSTSGTHAMTIDQTVTRLPNDKPHLVVGQIYGGDDDVSVFRSGSRAATSTSPTATTRATSW